MINSSPVAQCLHFGVMITIREYFLWSILIIGCSEVLVKDCFDMINRQWLGVVLKKSDENSSFNSGRPPFILESNNCSGV